MEPATVRPMPTEPSNGDLVLHCGHMLSSRKFCFFAPEGVRYKRPDPDNPYKRLDAVANWVICCPKCNEESGGDPGKLKLKGDGIWEKK